MYDSIIVGGGIAGLQAAIQLGRYRRTVVVIDREDGRSTLCRSYHNVLGYPEGVSGEWLRQSGRKQAAAYGVQFVAAEAAEAERHKDGIFTVACRKGGRYAARSVLLATGVKDRIPEVPGLRPCLGLTVYICPDCDGYEIRGKRTLVLGSGNAGAGMALELMYHKPAGITLINHERIAATPELEAKLAQAGIETVPGPIEHIVHNGPEHVGTFAGVRLKDGTAIEAERAFIAFGGNEVRSDLAAKLGVERMENKHIATDSRSKMTNVPGVWAAGDVAVHSQQLTIAMGEGLQAAIWMHKWLLKQDALTGMCSDSGSGSGNSGS
ncbi:NAD(P)/FAD-dependent oxidoreductase [Paenibacillus thermotolerans]|uniref:NAD(P)/FAD-dependent oxidoreductase n=1 Tax=Paenibacillus thermotolerans TaxID=3027807 RepID=UPI002368B99F|nr:MULTISPECIES: NAD(P)/FAD-dependent oxidoreductase [unclassified Paenibacillus]